MVTKVFPLWLCRNLTLGTPRPRCRVSCQPRVVESVFGRPLSLSFHVIYLFNFSCGRRQVEVSPSLTLRSFGLGVDGVLGSGYKSRSFIEEHVSCCWPIPLCQPLAHTTSLIFIWVVYVLCEPPPIYVPVLGVTPQSLWTPFWNRSWMSLKRW